MSGYVVAVGVGPGELVLLGKESGLQVKFFTKQQADTVVARINSIDPDAEAHTVGVASARFILDLLKKAKANATAATEKRADQTNPREPAQHSIRRLPSPDGADVARAEIRQSDRDQGSLVPGLSAGQTVELRSTSLD